MSDSEKESNVQQPVFDLRDVLEEAGAIVPVVVVDELIDESGELSEANPTIPSTHDDLPVDDAAASALALQRKIDKQKRETFRQRCKTIEKNVKEVIEATGGHAFFKASFTSASGKPADYYAGTPFASWSRDSTEPASLLEMFPVTKEQVEVAMDEALNKKVVPLLTKIAEQSASSATPSTSGTSVFSPVKCKGTVKSKECCDFCGKAEVIRGYQRYESEWMQCSGDDKPCSQCAHAFCAGFPGATKRDIQQMPKFYCETHRPYGAGINSVGVTFASGPPAAPPCKGKRKRKDT